MKEKIATFYFIKLLLIVRRSKEKKKKEKQVTHCQGIFTMPITNIGLISRLYEELLQINRKNSNSLLEKWAKALYSLFTVEATHMTNNYVKIYSKSLVIQ